jgi:hypothetical protein
MVLEIGSHRRSATTKEKQMFHRRHHHPQTRKVIALTVAVAFALALVAPVAASARYAQDPPTDTSRAQVPTAVNPYSHDAANPAVRAIAAHAARVAHELNARDGLTASPPPPIIKVSPANGFDWGDAGIGAAGGLALATLGVGAGLAISRDRPRRTRQTTGLPN